MTRAWAAIAALLAAGAGVVLALTGDDEPAKQAKADAPNFIVIMTDDQALNSWSREVMPRTFGRIVDRGTEFKQAFATPPLCCPARASFITGRFAHNHGVLSNNYRRLEDKEDTLPVWLSEAGYETMFAGKYLNGYERFLRHEGDEVTEPAPGWDRWWSMLGDGPKYFDYEVSDDGEAVARGFDPEDYATDALSDVAVDFMQEQAGSKNPYFMWLGHFGPHFAPRDDPGSDCPPATAPIALPRDFDRAARAKLPRDPSFYEADVSDKPRFVASLPGLTKLKERSLELSYRCTVASLAAVDRSVKLVFETLEETGEADETVVFFISDNGFYFGEHRKPGQKKWPYDPGARVPLAVVAPPGLLPRRQAPTSDAIVGTVDLAPTMLELAGLEGEHRMDGRSLVGLLQGNEGAFPADRALPLELGSNEKCVGYRALRDPAHLYVEWQARAPGEGCAVGARELYDLREDPHMLENLLGRDGQNPAYAAQALRFEERLRTLEACSGIQGRDRRQSEPYCE